MAGFVVVVGLPVVAAGLVTAGLSAAGLVADDTTVTVSSDPPTDLLGLRADTVRVTATDATFRGLEIGVAGPRRWATWRSWSGPRAPWTASCGT